MPFSPNGKPPARPLQRPTLATPAKAPPRPVQTPPRQSVPLVSTAAMLRTPGNGHTPLPTPKTDALAQARTKALGFFPDGPGRVSIRQGLTIPGPAKSFASATAVVEIQLPCEANEESVKATADIIRTLEEDVLDSLLTEAAAFLTKNF